MSTRGPTADSALSAYALFYVTGSITSTATQETVLLYWRHGEWEYKSIITNILITIIKFYDILFKIYARRRIIRYATTEPPAPPTVGRGWPSVNSHENCVQGDSNDRKEGKKRPCFSELSSLALYGAKSSTSQFRLSTIDSAVSFAGRSRRRTPELATCGALCAAMCCCYVLHHMYICTAPELTDAACGHCVTNCFWGSVLYSLLYLCSLNLFVR